MNLIINASEAIGANQGAIRINTSHRSGTGAGQLLLEVSDTGRGMTDEQKARVFDPFFTTKFSGRGLGLAVVEGIIRSHHGTIQLESELGRGTSFRILLPCTDQDLPKPLFPVAQPLARTPSIKTILVVEDEDSLRLALSKMLRVKGFSVVEAADGHAAIDTLRTHSDIDAILLDMTIPGTSSPEVLAQAARLRPRIVVILTSAYSQETAAPFLDMPQVRGFIRKPFQFSAVLELLQ